MNLSFYETCGPVPPRKPSLERCRCNICGEWLAGDVHGYDCCPACMNTGHGDCHQDDTLPGSMTYRRILADAGVREARELFNPPAPAMHRLYL